jgi:hypothetical protein
VPPHDVTVRVTPPRDGWVADVTVRQSGQTTRHAVHVRRGSLERLSAKSPPEDLVRASVDFLLEREPSSSILREFDINVIAGYFPEYPDEIAGRLMA